MRNEPTSGLFASRYFRGPLLGVLTLGLLGGCAALPRSDDAVREQRPLIAPAPYYLRRHLDDPFLAIETATRRVSYVNEAQEAEVKDHLWGQAIDRFQFAQCEGFPEATAWAQWFGERPEYMSRVMDRAKPWLHDILTEIDQRDLPGELALLPIVESAYDPFAYSHGRAAGAWQFVAPTAISHGIEINDWYDGRRDVYVATRAALDYLTQLNGRFDGDWNLALAAYNGGQGRVSRAIARNARANRPTDWQSLRLPRETKGYIPKLHGLACLFQNADSYGLEIPIWPNEPVIEKVSFNAPIDVVVFSALLGLEVSELVALNPGLNRHITSPTGPHHLIVPKPYGARARALAIEVEQAQWVQYQSIKVQAGDSLSMLANRYDTSIDELKKHNNLRSDLIRVGQVLDIPSAINPQQPAQYGDRYQELAQLQARLVPAKRFEHRVEPGESLWVIARRYQVSLSDLQRWNSLGENHLIRPGQRLTIVIEPEFATGTAATTLTRYTVRTGDSLWAIAQRHRIPLSDLMEQNDLDHSSVLRPGQTITLNRASSSE